MMPGLMGMNPEMEAMFALTESPAMNSAVSDAIMQAAGVPSPTAPFLPYDRPPVLPAGMSPALWGGPAAGAAPGGMTLPDWTPYAPRAPTPEPAPLVPSGMSSVPPELRGQVTNISPDSALAGWRPEQQAGFLEMFGAGSGGQ